MHSCFALSRLQFHSGKYRLQSCCDSSISWLSHQSFDVPFYHISKGKILYHFVEGLFSPETEQCFSKEYVRADADKKQSKYSIREFVAERPLPDVEYFGKYTENSMSRGLTVVIPFYNEETLAITETLKDVNTNISMVIPAPSFIFALDRYFTLILIPKSLRITEDRPLKQLKTTRYHKKHLTKIED